MHRVKNVVLGAGIAGISAAYHLKKNGENAVVYEKSGDWGGLCSYFTINGFRFDKFVHFTFTDDPYIKSIFENSSPLFEHPPVSSNYYRGFWLKHPAQNNLAPLPAAEKVKIISDFVNRPQIEISNIKDYSEWLRVQYGNYFAENFPFKYTRKYWGVEPEILETKWVGNRMHSPSLDEILKGAFEEQKENFYYAKYMRYPKKGGFRSILDSCRQSLDIVFNKNVCAVDADSRKVFFSDGSSIVYDRLISSVPLPEIVAAIKNAPQEIISAANSLMHTSGYMVSLGFNRADVAKHLWFYIYDEDIPPSRVYSPSLKSPDNAPKNCSSLQAEIFFANDSDIPSAQEILNNTIEKLASMGIFNKKDLLVKDVRFEKYANVIFNKDIYKNRKTVLDYLNSVNIESIGRFGKWDYMWTHQAFADGMKTALKQS